MADGIENRKFERLVDPDIILKINDRVHRTVNWCMDGALIESFDGGAEKGALLNIAEMGHGDSDLRVVNIRARVVRAEPAKKQVALHFLGVDDPTYDFLQELTSQRAQFLKEQLSAH